MCKTGCNCVCSHIASVGVNQRRFRRDALTADVQTTVPLLSSLTVGGLEEWTGEGELYFGLVHTQVLIVVLQLCN